MKAESQGWVACGSRNHALGEPRYFSVAVYVASPQLWTYTRNFCSNPLINVIPRVAAALREVSWCGRRTGEVVAGLCAMCGCLSEVAGTAAAHETSTSLAGIVSRW